MRLFNLTACVLLFVTAGLSQTTVPVARQLFCTAPPLSSGGTAYACTITGLPSFAYASGTHYWLQADVDNTGSVTFQFNTGAALAVTKPQSSIATALVPGDIRAGQWVEVIYDGTRFQMQSQLGNTPAGSGAGRFQSFTSATSVVVPGIGTQFVVLACIDASGNFFNPSSAVSSGTAPNNVTVTFGSSTSGTCTITAGGGAPGATGATGAPGPGTFGGCVIKTANYTLTSSDSGTCIELDGASLTVTIPATWLAAYQARVININASPLAVNTNGLKINKSTAYGPIPGCGNPAQGCPLMALYADGDAINYNTTSGPPGPAGSIFFSSVNSAGAGPSATATETSIVPTPNSGSQTLPGATWVNGTQVTLVATGRFSTPASTSDTAVATVYCGATVLGQTAAITLSGIGLSIANQQWDLTAYIGATTVGTTGLLVNSAINFRTAAGTLFSFGLVNTSTVAFTLSTSCALDVKVKFSGSTSGEAILGTNAQASLSGVGPQGIPGVTGSTGLQGPTGLTGSGVGPTYAAGQGFIQIGGDCAYCQSAAPITANMGIIIQFQVVGAVAFPLRTLQVVAGTNSSPTIAQAIYSDASGSCGTLIAQTATGTLAASGLGSGLSFAATQTLGPGFYWWAITGDGTFALFENGFVQYLGLGMNEANAAGTVVHPRIGTVNTISGGSGGSLAFLTSCGTINLSTAHSPLVFGFPG